MFSGIIKHLVYINIWSPKLHNDFKDTIQENTEIFLWTSFLNTNRLIVEQFSRLLKEIIICTFGSRYYDKSG